MTGKNTKKKSGPVPIEATRHKDKRKNIPTRELRDFATTDEKKPQKMLYPRDSSLDPQLVWKGKDEQDQGSLEVPIVPVYIQEKIPPQALIENFRKTAKSKQKDPELPLFNDFNGIHDFEKKVEFYKHNQNWSNRMILGDSQLVMTSLAEKESLKGKVQCIYVDPPYGIKFGSNWQVSTRKRDVKESKVEDVSRQPEQVRAFRDTWEFGIHSYLAYLRDRLALSHELLTETGSIFVQIGDENVHLVRCVLDEVFGSENYCRTITFQKTGSIQSNTLGRTVDFILWYAKKKTNVKYNQLYLKRQQGDAKLDRYDFVETKNGELNRIPAAAIRGEKPLPTGNRCRLTTLMSDGESKEKIPFLYRGQSFPIRHGKHWKTDPKIGGQRLIWANRIIQQGKTLWYKRFVEDFPVVPLNDRWESLQIGTELAYVVQTASKVIERCLLMTTDPGDLILDPTCGSGTTAFVAEQWGRRWITIDTSRVALALARTRLTTAKFPYYLLSDSIDGIAKKAEITGKTPPSYTPENDIRKGFVYKRVPHITLGAIANNPEIKEGMTQEEINLTIASHAEQEILVDQPYESNKKIRVSGPFTVESLSPYRVISTADKNMDGTVSEEEGQQQQDFVAMLLENLQKAGVQNTIKQERISLNNLTPYAGSWIHATGDYLAPDKQTKRVAISIGPEHGTVGPNQVKEAAKEAVQGVGFDILIVCGFAFDPHVNEETKRYGKLRYCQMLWIVSMSLSSIDNFMLPFLGCSPLLHL